MRRHAVQWMGWLAMGGLLACAPAAWAATPQMVVITAPDAPRLTFDRATLRDVYLKKIFVDGRGHRITPVNLPNGAPLREAFARVFLHMDDGQLQDYWNRQYFQGVSPPYVLASVDAVVRFVAKTPGAIGYVSACEVDASVRVVMTVTLPPRLGTELPACPEHHAPP